MPPLQIDVGEDHEARVAQALYEAMAAGVQEASGGEWMIDLSKPHGLVCVRASVRDVIAVDPYFEYQARRMSEYDHLIANPRHQLIDRLYLTGHPPFNRWTARGAPLRIVARGVDPDSGWLWWLVAYPLDEWPDKYEVQQYVFLGGDDLKAALVP